MFEFLFILCILTIIAIYITSCYVEEGLLNLLIIPIFIVAMFLLVLSDTPAAIDVYQEKTTLKYTVVDGVKTDSTVIWKKNLNN